MRGEERGRVFSVENTWTMFKRDSCSFSHDNLAQGDLCSGQRRKGRSSSPAPNSKAKTDDGGERSSTTSGNREEGSSDKMSEVPCRYSICQKPVM